MRLYVLRHAEAFDAKPGQRDFDRELTPKGQAQAAFVGEWFRGRGVPCDVWPQVVRTSPAPRAHATARTVADALGVPLEVEDRVSLRADLGDAMDLVSELTARFESAMIVGHNPTLSDLVHRLCGAGEVRKGECVVIGWARAGAGNLELGRVRR